jgi:hypothetical protein
MVRFSAHKENRRFEHGSVEEHIAHCCPFVRDSSSGQSSDISASLFPLEPFAGPSVSLEVERSASVKQQKIGIFDEATNVEPPEGQTR